MKEIDLRFKNASVMKEVLLVGIHPLMMELLLFLDEEYGVIPTITSGYRSGDKGVHGTKPLRGIDIRSWGNSYSPLELAETINEEFCYDNRRPHLKCAKYHDVGQGAHLHLQVHPNTQRHLNLEG